jgi:hypothetical protein
MWSMPLAHTPFRQWSPGKRKYFLHESISVLHWICNGNCQVIKTQQVSCFMSHVLCNVYFIHFYFLIICFMIF